MKGLCYAILVFFILLAFLDYRNFKNDGIDLIELLPDSEQTNSIESITMADGSATIKCDAANDAYVIIPLTVRTFFWKHLFIEFEDLDGISKFDVYYSFKGDKGFSLDQRVIPKNVKRSSTSFYWYLPPGDYQELRIDFEGRSGAHIVVKELRLYDFSYLFRGQAYFYPLAWLIFLMLVVPGSAIFVMTTRNTVESGKENLLLFFFYSLIFYLSFYLVLVVVLKTGQPARMMVTAAYCVGLMLLAFGITIRGRWKLFRKVFREEKKVFIISLLLITLCSLFVTRFSIAPFEFESVNHNTVDRQVIFSRFGGHDNMFQFVNGMAIAEDEPFSKYYSGGKLTYQVQDRGILPGVIYSVFRTVLSAWNSYIGESYLTYTLFGLCMNLMVLFPLVVLFRRYFSERYLLPFLLILLLNTYVFPNFYFTWFKFSGASLFLCGLLFLLDRRGSLVAWCFAGLAFGLASSMHAGNALAYPLVFLWLMGWNIKDYGLFSRQVLAWPAALFGMFVLVNIPWSVVKSLYFPEKYSLIREHYLPGSEGDGLLECFLDFHKSHPLSEQLHTRWLNLVEASRLEEFSICWQLLFEGRYEKFIRVFNNWQFFFAIFSIGPLACIALVAKLVSLIGKGLRKTKEKATEIMAGSPVEMYAMLFVSCGTIVSMVYLYYGDHPDINHQHPPGATLIIHSLLIGMTLQSGRVGQLMIGVYGLFSLWRIYMHSVLFIFV